jgi:DMSO reductase family type II enzyme heme b subunit
MPSYADLIAEEDRWHLVDFVYSLSRDEAEYSTLVTAIGVEGSLEPQDLAPRFEEAVAGFFPLFGQIVEPGRNFHPAATAVEVKVLYDDDEVFFRLAWNDMTPDTLGENLPSLETPESVTEDPAAVAGTTSDAVAVQLPAAPVSGAVRPYILFGDARNPVDLLFADLAREGGERFVGRGSSGLERAGVSIPVTAGWEAGQWSVVFRHPRRPEGGPAFDEGTFVPLAVSVWDGFNGERGNRRSLTSWYHVYVAPLDMPSPVLPAAGYAFVVVLVEFAIVHVARRKHGVKPPPWLTPHVPEGIDLGFSLLGGLVATMAMTVFLHLVMPALLGTAGALTLFREAFEGKWVLGVSLHFVMGALIFPLVFVEFFYERVPGPAWMRGVIWGALLWVVAELVAIPLAAGGVFHADAGGIRGVLGFLIGHLIYGAVLGAVTASSGPDREEAVHHP